MKAPALDPAQVRAAKNVLVGILNDIGDVAVAVSGGVDSTTLAAIAAARTTGRTKLFHALSPAVPDLATRRLRQAAQAFEWHLHEIHAGELDDPDYVANPVNRCFFCKHNLYQTIAQFSDDTLCSGTNLDDLGDFRPGLTAAKNHQVRHPFVEAGIDKAMVRALAMEMNLTTFADLPASPCLSSRIETGIPVSVAALQFIQATETALQDLLSPRTLRCRLFHNGIVIELDPEALIDIQANSARHRAAADRVGALALEHRLTQPISFTAYQRGAAFRQQASIMAEE